MAIDGKAVLQAIEELEIQKGISKESIVNALQEALEKSLLKQIGRGDEPHVKATIDLTTGDISLGQFKTVVKDDSDEDFDSDLEITLEDAKKYSKEAKVGEEIFIPVDLENSSLRKAFVMSVKSSTKQKFSEAEKEVLRQTYADKIDTMVTGKVERAENQGLTVNIGRVSVYLPRKNMIGDERFSTGDSIKLYVTGVGKNTQESPIEVTRANDKFLQCLFTEEIHEIYDGTIVIKKVVRFAGVRSKVAVFSKDPNVDPAGACIGQNGSRIQKIVGQLGNGQSKEKIDIVTYSEVPGLYICEALKPAHILGVHFEGGNKVTAITKEENLISAIGRSGINVKLAKKLTDYDIDVISEADALEMKLDFISYEELQAEDLELKNKRLAEAKVNVSHASVLPGLPEGYVAPTERNYDKAEEENDELDEALIEASEKEETKEFVKSSEVKEEKPDLEVKTEKAVDAAPAKEEVAEEHKAVKTTTSLEDLEKSLDAENARNKAKDTRRSFKKNKKEEEEEDNSTPIQTSGPRMSIYTEEELREMEEEDQNNEEENDDDDVDYDDYDEYYDDDNR